jgi:hypothetical protein
MPVNSDAVEDAMVEASRANLMGGMEAYARLVSGQQAAASRAPSAARRSRQVEPTPTEPAARPPRRPQRSTEPGMIEHYEPDILD